MNAVHLILIVLVILIVLSLPIYPYNTAWGYYPSGAVTLIVPLMYRNDV